MSDKTISKWERGEGAPDLSNLVPLAQALELTTDELLAGEQSPNKIAVAQKENPYRFTKAEKGLMMLGAEVGGILGLLAYNNGWI